VFALWDEQATISKSNISHIRCYLCSLCAKINQPSFLSLSKPLLMRFIYFITAFFLFSFVSFAQKNKPDNDAKLVAAFDEYIKQALPIWQTPGISVAVVKDGKTIFKKGYGLRELGKPQPYTTATLSTCASTTKAMTAVCMGILVDEGKVKWTDKVTDLLPAFKLADPYSSAEITVLDLFTHNAGLGNADNLWVFGYSREEILQRIQLMEPAYSLRSSYIYQNLMYIVAGQLIKSLSGKTWDEFIKERIFKEVGMNNTYADHSALTADMDMTTSHYTDKDTIKAIPYLYSDNIGPAGGVWSCADDMAKWLQCVLDSTKINGKRLLKPATYATLFTPHVIAPLTMYPTMEILKPHWFTYGLGWFQHDYKGKMVQFHTGSLAGLTAIAGLIPEEHFGIYIFGNLDHAELRHALMYKAFDLWAFNDNSKDWSKILYEHYTAIADSAKTHEKEELEKRVLNTKPSLPLAGYTGKFLNKRLATLEVTLKDATLILTMPGSISLTLQHWNYETFRGSYNRWWFGHSWVQFLPAKDGKIQALVIDDIQYAKID
jgi:CubicO group peptidase (beta-lactamase class C family)